MNPKEKAKELLSKYYNLHYIYLNVNYNLVKEAAIIAVDEIIEQWDYIDTYLANGRGELNPNLKYWYEVKKHIKENDNF